MPKFNPHPLFPENPLYEIHSEAEIPHSDRYELWCDGRRQTVYHTDSFDYAVVVRKNSEHFPVEIHVSTAFKDVVIRPLSVGVSFEREEDVIRFTLPGPVKISVELDGNLKTPLFILTTNYVAPPDPAPAYFFRKGHVYNIGSLELKSGECAYLEEGSIVCGRIRHKRGKALSAAKPPPTKRTSSFSLELPVDLAHRRVAGGLGFVGVDVHRGRAADVHADDDVVEDQLAALAAAGDADDLLILDAHGRGVLLADVQVALGDDDALAQLDLALRPDQLTCAGALDVAALADGRIDAEVAGIGGGELDLIGLAHGAENGDVGLLTLGADDGQALVAGELAGVGQVLALGQLIALTKQLFHRLLRQVDGADVSTIKDIVITPSLFVFLCRAAAFSVRAARQSVSFSTIRHCNTFSSR